MNTGQTTYAIRVEGHLDGHWADWLGGIAMTYDDDGTVLTLSVADQTQLHGVLLRLRDIGAVLTALRTVGPPRRCDSGLDASDGRECRISGYAPVMTEPNRDPNLDDVLDPAEQAHPDHREHAKTPHPVDDAELERRAEHERRALHADGPLRDR